VPFDSVLIPLADTAVDKLLSWRETDDGSLEILVKYKVFFLSPSIPHI